MQGREGDCELEHSFSVKQLRNCGVIFLFSPPLLCCLYQSMPSAYYCMQVNVRKENGQMVVVPLFHNLESLVGQVGR